MDIKLTIHCKGCNYGNPEMLVSTGLYGSLYILVCNKCKKSAPPAATEHQAVLNWNEKNQPTKNG